jgi:hypothetical protein
MQLLSDPAKAEGFARVVFELLRRGNESARWIDLGLGDYLLGFDLHQIIISLQSII